MTEHTKEPWKIGSSPAGKSVVFLVGDEPEHTLGPDENWIDCNTEANARRVVACVNAMAGIGDDNVLFRRGSIGTVRKHIVTQQVQIEKLTAQRDQLQAQLEAERSAWSAKRAELLRNHDAELERRKNAEVQLQAERASLFAESQRKQQSEQQRDQLLAALEAIIELHDSARRGSDVAATISNARAAIAAVKGN